ncbi:MAG TPA: hypothetical protein DCF78_00470 [Dehalococcoidia bacterium]|nr:hypothetical protein [Dehalococcoidia bacterium]
MIRSKNKVKSNLNMEQTFLDPGFISPASWQELGNLQRSLGLAVLFIVLFASNMLIGHNMIPSFIESRHIAASWGRIRPVLYGFAIIFFALAVFFVQRATVYAGVLRDFWPDYWI